MSEKRIICTGNDACETGICLGTAIPEAPTVEPLDRRSREVDGQLNTLELHDIGNGAFHGQSCLAERQVEIGEDILAIHKVMPGADLAIGPEWQLVYVAAKIEVKNAVVIRANRQ